jgi:nucleotide-binding universal stress UspA family protein
MYNNIVVPLDGSPFAEHALPLALAIAARAQAEVRLALVHVPVALPYDGGTLMFDAGLDMSLRDQETTYLADLATRLAGISHVKVSHFLLDGPIADTLRGFVETVRGDLVVMTTHGRGPLSRFWIGSVADQLIRHLPGRLLLIRPTDEPTDFARPPALRRILIPLDGSDFSEQMIKPALAFGTLMDAEYTLVRVINPIVPHFESRYADHATVDFGVRLEHQLDRLQKQVRIDAEAYLERVAVPLRSRSFTVRTLVVSHAQAPVAILELARSLPADIIALKTHGRYGISRLVMGSVADKVVRGASVPVLL